MWKHERDSSPMIKISLIFSLTLCQWMLWWCSWIHKTPLEFHRGEKKFLKKSVTPQEFSQTERIPPNRYIRHTSPDCFCSVIQLSRRLRSAICLETVTLIPCYWLNIQPPSQASCSGLPHEKCGDILFFSSVFCLFFLWLNTWLCLYVLVGFFSLHEIKKGYVD